MKYVVAALAVCSLVLFSCNPETDSSSAGHSTWRVKGGNPGTTQYSSLASINKENAASLKVAWVYRAGDADTVRQRTQIQCNPIIVDGVLYATSPRLQAFAIDAASGKEVWRFAEVSEADGGLGVNRGVTYWEEGDDKRILYSAGKYLYALNAITGKRVLSFGDSGRVSLKEGLGERAADKMVVANSPGVVYKNLIIMGSRVHEGPAAAPGYIRAYDTKTGKLAWVFHTIPQPGEPGYETWPANAWEKIGGANSWSGMSVDEKRGMVFAGTGSASFDFWGGNRKGANLYANCILALDAETGERKWHFQTVHHDLWDRDLPAAPILGTVKHNGKPVDVVIQTTKTGHVYVLNRDTGESLFPIEEVKVPPSDLEGEEASPTQPLPVKPPAFARQAFTRDMINKITPEIESFVTEQFEGLRTGGPFVPPSKEGTIVFPGFDGGAEWGGASYDPSGILYVNANEMPWILKMVDVRMTENTWLGLSLYMTNCATCHGFDRGGDGHVYPPLKNLQTRFSKESAKKFILNGKGAMPAFSHLSDKERDAIARYILDLERTEEEKQGIFERDPDVIFSNTGYIRFLTPEGYPAVEPPWGTLNAVDINKGEIKWQVPLGEYPELTSKGIPPTGTENYGGPVATDGGVVFIAASRDEKFRVFDKDTGKVLWEYQLPAAGYATPSVYEVEGKQYVVIACGGGKSGTKSGDSYIAFTLP